MNDLKKRDNGLYQVFLILFTLFFLVLVFADNQTLLENGTEIGQLEIFLDDGVEMPVIIESPTETIPNDDPALPEEGSVIIEPPVNNAEPETTPVVEEPSLIETFISLVVDGAKAFVGEVVNIKAILTDENYTPITDKRIDFYADELIGSDLTDNGGVAEISGDTSRYSPRLYTITANYSSDNLLKSSSTNIDVLVEDFTINRVNNLIGDIYNPQDLNKYSYVRNNPYRYVDPDGEFLNVAIGAVVGVGVGANLINQVYHGASMFEGSVNWREVGIGGS